MRILILTASESWGGLETHAAALAETLGGVGHHVTIGSIGTRGYELYRSRLDGPTTIVDFGADGNRGFVAWMRALRRVPADVVVLEKGTLHMGGLTLDLALRLLFRRFIAVMQLEPPPLPPRSSRRHLGGLLPGLGLWWFRQRWNGYLRSWLPHVTVCVSENVRQRLLTDYRFPARRMVTIENGVDGTKFTPDSGVRLTKRMEWGVPPDAFVFGSVGRHVHQKALEVAVAAFAQLLTTQPDRRAFLVLVGDGPDRPNLEQLAVSLGVRDRVVFPGYSSDPRASYRALDVFLIPSRHEGLPFALVEAIACGCHSIGSDIPGIREVISDPALGALVAPDNPEQLAAAMAAAVASHDDQLRADRIRTARERVLRRFDFGATSRRLAEYFEPKPLPRGIR